MGFLATLYKMSQKTEDLNPKFKTYYDEHIVPFIEIFEKRQQEALVKQEKAKAEAKKALPVILVINLCAAFALYYAEVFENFFLILAGLMAPFLLYYFIRCNNGPVYGNDVKNEVFPVVMKFFGDEFNYRSFQASERKPEEKDPLEVLEVSEIIPVHHDSLLDDHFTGSYNGVDFEFLEAELTGYVRDDDGERERGCVFKGFILSLDFNKNFKGRTVVKIDDRGVDGRYRVQSHFRGMEQVHLEESRFEQYFDVYSTDQIEARYLLTPAMMSRFAKFRDSFIREVGDFQASFYDNKLVITVPSKPLFEPWYHHEGQITFVNDINTVIREMEHIFSIIDDLKLDENTRV